MFYVWETITFDIQVDSDNDNLFEDVKNVIVSFGQSNILVEKDLESGAVVIDSENKTVSVPLNQKETGLFKPDRDVIVQLNILYNNAERDTSAQTKVKAMANLHKEVMT